MESRKAGAGATRITPLPGPDEALVSEARALLRHCDSYSIRMPLLREWVKDPGIAVTSELLVELREAEEGFGG